MIFTLYPYNRPNPYTELRTIDGVGADELPELTGSGYITLTRAWGTAADDINVYIDGNSTPFSIDGLSTQTFLFNKSIRFTNGSANNGYYVQILSSKTPVKDYDVMQSMAWGSALMTVEGKGKALFNAIYSDATLYFSVDDGFLSILPLTMYKPVWISFKNKIVFSCENDEQFAQFVIYRHPPT